MWIALLGGFRLVGNGKLIGSQRAAKLENLLSSLVLAETRGVARDALLAAVWPNTPVELSSQSLNSLMHSTRQLLATSLDGAAPILISGGTYRLNVNAGISSDVFRFDELVREGDCCKRQGNENCANARYSEAVLLYRGDLCASGDDLAAVMERERLRAEYLTLLSRLSDHAFAEEDYEAALRLAQRLLQADPCREDAYRRTMQAHVRLGQRAQAMRQYQLCERILRTEFDVTPEPATRAMFEALRAHPEQV